MQWGSPIKAPPPIGRAPHPLWGRGWSCLGITVLDAGCQGDGFQVWPMVDMRGKGVAKRWRHHDRLPLGTWMAYAHCLICDRIHAYWLIPSGVQCETDFAVRNRGGA